MWKPGRQIGQLAEQLHEEVPAFREQLQQVADDAQRTFSRVEDAATAVTATLVVAMAVGVTALLLATIAVVAIRRQPL